MSETTSLTPTQRMNLPVIGNLVEPNRPERTNPT
jgi:hypothetical protein